MKIYQKGLPFVNELKLRSSFGLSSKDGNNSYYGAQAVYALNQLTTYGGKNYLQMSQPGNENLRWEKPIPLMQVWTWKCSIIE